MRAFLRILRFEALAMARLSELHMFGVFPALLLVPGSLAGMVLFLSFRPTPTVVVPESDPGFPVQLDGYDVTRRDDPGDAELAVLAWSVQDGTLTATVRATERAPHLEGTLRKAFLDDVDRRIVAAGGEAPADRIPYLWRAASSIPATPMALLAHLWLVAAAYLGAFVLPARTASDRLAGVLEAFAATRTSLLPLLAARWLVGMATTGAIVAIPMVFLALLVPIERFDPSVLRWHAPIEAVALLGLFTAGHVAVGAMAGSTRTALTYASYIAIGAIALAGAGLLAGDPAFPGIGLGYDAAVPVLVLRIAVPALATVAVLAGAERWLRAENVLPPGHSDE